MTVLTSQIFNLKAAASILDPHRLTRFMADAYHHLCEIAVQCGGRILPANPSDLMVVWDSTDATLNADLACTAAWRLLQRSKEVNSTFVERYGVEITPRTGIATGLWRTDGNDNEMTARPITRAEIKALSRVVQRANTVMETPILVDDVTASAAAKIMSFCEIDFFSEDGCGMAQLISKLGDRDADSIDVFPPCAPVFRVSELLGPIDEVSADRMGAAMAFRSAMELYRQGELAKAASVLELLSTGPSRGALARYYLSRCRSLEATNPQQINKLAQETLQSA
jgi:hypothetical protein